MSILRESPLGAPVAFLFLVSGVASAQFGAAHSFPSGPGARAVAVGDLDGDSLPDAAVANGADLSILLGNGAGGFGAPAHHPVAGSDPRTLVLCDANNDGRLDIVTGNHGSKSMSVLLGTGGGAFAPAAGFATALPPDFVRAADLNGDGAIDWVVYSLSFGASSQVHVLLGNGAGGMGTASPATSSSGDTAMAIADTNLDGKTDLLVAHYIPNDIWDFNSVSIKAGNGAGGFASPGTSLSVGGFPHAIALGDLNHDGFADFVTANLGSIYPIPGGSPKGLSIVRSNGAGGFAPKQNVSISLIPDSLLLGDVTGDGNEDLLGAYASSATIGVFVGDGSAGFGAQFPFAAPVGSGAQAMALSDLDGDGGLDLLAADPALGQISVLRNATAPPAGIAIYGIGTPGCAGALGLGAASAPHAGDPNFRITCTNAPAASLGLCLVTNAQDSAGSDILGIGLLFHTDPLAATDVLGLAMSSDDGASAFAPAPIPNNPFLVGSAYYAQAFWVEPVGATCTPAAAGLVSSRGLSLVIQP